MELAILLPAAVAVTVFLAIWFDAPHRAEAWRYAARRAGLTNVREKTMLGMITELRGVADDFGVQITQYHRGKHEHGTRVVVEGRGQISSSLDLRAESFGTTLDRTFGGKEIEVGDAGFDAEVYAQGPEDLLLPLLDHDTRGLLRALVGVAGRVVDGVVRVEMRGRARRDKLAQVLEISLRTAQALRTPVDPVARLAQNVRSGSLPRVRLRCLDLLARKYAGHELARDALREALDWPNAEMRLIAARALGAEGHATLIELASSTSGDESVASRAIEALGARLPIERATAILDEVRRLGRPGTALAVIGALAAIGGADAIAHLSPLLADPDGELAISATHALAAIGDTCAETPLIAALASENDDLRVAVANALGQLGSAAAVAPLHAAVDAHLLDLSLRSAARQAIASIQSRLPGASPGQISLAEAEAGQVSIVAGDVVGQVSVLPEDGDKP